MPRKKKEKAQQEEPAKTAKAAVEEKPATERKTRPNPATTVRHSRSASPVSHRW